MRRFRFAYTLALSFSAPVCRHTFSLRFAPQTDETQQVWGVDTLCTPASSLPAIRDAFGNLCAVGHIEGEHDALTFSVSGEALLRGGAIAAPCPDIYAMPSAMTAADARIVRLGQGLCAGGADAALQIAERLTEHVRYQKGVTDRFTTAIDAYDLGGGVCQDLAHLTLAALRANGMPARYVMGLIPGEGETHAWVEVYDGQRFVGVDPTHLRLTDDSYLRVATGRDSRDCAINRGVFSGAAQQEMHVTARMTEL